MCKTKTLSHTCPVCGGEVKAKRSDKIFCNLECKNKHHACQRKLHLHPEAELFMHTRRNLVLLDGILGMKHRSMEIKQVAMEKFNFKLNHCDRVDLEDSEDGILARYKLLSFEIDVLADGILRVSRKNLIIPAVIYESDLDIRNMFYNRWKIEFPEFVEGDVREEALCRYGVWRY